MVVALRVFYSYISYIFYAGLALGMIVGMHPKSRESVL